MSSMKDEAGHEDWSTDQVMNWLEETNPVLKNKYGTSFRDEGIDGKMLMDLDDSTLEEDLGVTSKLHRKRLLGAIDELKSGSSKRRKIGGDDAKEETKDEPEAKEEEPEAPVPAETASKEVEIAFSFDTTGE